VAIAAARAGRRLSMIGEWSHDEIAALAGLDRDADYIDAEREDPGCMLAIVDADRSPAGRDRATRVERGALLDAVRNGSWTGRASRLSADHVEWPVIDDIARATRDPGRPVSSIPPIEFDEPPDQTIQLPDYPITRLPDK